MPANIKCPNCGHEFEPTDLIRDEIQKEVNSKAEEWKKNWKKVLKKIASLSRQHYTKTE